MTNKKTESNKKCCDHPMSDDSPCGRPLFDSEHCIFHSREDRKKRRKFSTLFEQELARQMDEEQVLDFSGFIFSDEVSFNGIQFDKTVVFHRASFLGAKTDFNSSSFRGKRADFRGVHFADTRVHFRDSIFECEADFRGAEFSGQETTFLGASFKGKKTNFSRAVFSSFETIFFGTNFSAGKCEFRNTLFSGQIVDFQKAGFSGTLTSFKDAEFSGDTCLFRRTRFGAETTSFVNTKYASTTSDFNKANFSSASIDIYNAHFENVLGLFEVLRYRTGILKLLKYHISDFRFHLGRQSAITYPVIHRENRDAWYLNGFKNQHPIIYEIWKIFADCGRGILRWSLWSILFLILFALIYYFLFYLRDPSLFNATYINESFPFISFLYYSITVFSTLGFGDITPNSGWLQSFAMVEVGLGYVMLGGLISIFSNKLARRS